MCKLTIHTSSYNRGYILPKAYESLKAQTCKDFEWIITDDGSTDNTQEMVSEWLKQDNGFRIVYNRLEHVGLPRANNYGVSKSTTGWFLILDSDDSLLPETVEKVLRWVDEIAEDETFAGIGFLKCFPDGKHMKNMTPVFANNRDYVDATHLERKNFNLNMDMCEVHRTELFKKYPFQCWKTEYYAPPQLNYYQIALEGLKIRWHNEKLYVCDYLPDGLTKNNKKVKDNPMGYAMMFNQYLIFTESFKRNVFNAVQMIALCLYAGHPEYLKQSNKKWLTTLCMPIGWVWFLRRRKQFQNMD